MEFKTVWDNLKPILLPRIWPWTVIALQIVLTSIFFNFLLPIFKVKDLELIYWLYLTDLSLPDQVA